MEGFYLILNVLTIIQMVTSAVMCVYGYKWSKGLIAIMSLDMGVVIGFLLSILFIQEGAGLGVLIIIPICAAGFSGLAYKNITFNHFLAGFLLAIKVSFMIVTKMYEHGMVEDIGWLFVMPVIIGAVAGIASCTVFTGYIVLACLAFWGAIEFVPKMFELINGTLFVATGDIGYIFDPISLVLSLFGIEIPSGGEVFFILILSGVSFYLQKVRAEQAGIDLSRKIVDDRDLKE